MNRIDETVINETKYIGAWVMILSVLMQAIFLIIGKWSPAVVFGNLLSAVFTVLNFLLMGITVQRAIVKEEKEAKTMIKVSQLYRNLMILAVTVIGVALPCFNTVAVIVPVFFPRIAIMFRPLFDKK